MTVSSRITTRDRKSTRLNSSHPSISYAVFCLKKQKKVSARIGVWGALCNELQRAGHIGTDWCVVDDLYCAFVVYSFFFNDTATTEIYTLPTRRSSDPPGEGVTRRAAGRTRRRRAGSRGPWGDRKSTRLNSSHPSISYAVFCLKQKNQGGTYGTNAKVKPETASREDATSGVRFVCDRPT